MTSLFYDKNDLDWARGERNGNAKLNREIVRVIRRLSWEDISQAEVARIFGVSQQNVSSIQRLKRWVHL